VVEWWLGYCAKYVVALDDDDDEAKADGTVDMAGSGDEPSSSIGSVVESSSTPASRSDAIE